jgi:hypothetical protein
MEQKAKNSAEKAWVLVFDVFKGYLTPEISDTFP